jgi:anti-anti-sigma factor
MNIELRIVPLSEACLTWFDSASKWEFHSCGNYEPDSMKSPVDQLNVEVHRGSEVCVVRFEGSLGAMSVKKVQRVMAQLSRSTCSSVILDASLLREIDDIGVRSLAGLQHRVKSRGGKMIIYAASGRVAKTLEDFSLGR